MCSQNALSFFLSFFLGTPWTTYITWRPSLLITGLPFQTWPKRWEIRESTGLLHSKHRQIYFITYVNYNSFQELISITWQSQLGEENPIEIRSIWIHSRQPKYCTLAALGIFKPPGSYRGSVAPMYGSSATFFLRQSCQSFSAFHTCQWNTIHCFHLTENTVA